MNVLLDDLNPFTSDYLYDMVTVVDDDDLKQWNLYSEESLLEKYRQSQDILKEASPGLPENFNSNMS